MTGIGFSIDETVRDRDQFDPEIPEAMEAQVFLEWLAKGESF